MIVVASLRGWCRHLQDRHIAEFAGNISVLSHVTGVLYYTLHQAVIVLHVLRADIRMLTGIGIKRLEQHV